VRTTMNLLSRMHLRETSYAVIIIGGYALSTQCVSVPVVRDDLT